MGITFLAAGTSIPDAMASVYVVRQGMGDMAVSNSIGSNVFDILLGLALPWFIQTAMVEPGSYVHINSNGMVYSILLLFLTVIVTVVAIQQSHWTLNRYVGLVCLTTYVLYLLLSVMIECNVLGFVNLPMCDEWGWHFLFFRVKRTTKAKRKRGEEHRNKKKKRWRWRKRQENWTKTKRVTKKTKKTKGKNEEKKKKTHRRNPDI